MDTVTKAQIDDMVKTVESLCQFRIKFARKRMDDPLFSTEYWQGVVDATVKAIQVVQNAFCVETGEQDESVEW